jgi:hypothetical protein
MKQPLLVGFGGFVGFYKPGGSLFYRTRCEWLDHSPDEGCRPAVLLHREGEGIP